jgi:hypothetical protein
MSEKTPRGHVRCEACGATQKLDRTRAAYHGWPQCCGVYMKPNKKPKNRYEVRLRSVRRRPDVEEMMWCATQYQGMTGIARGETYPRPDDTEAEILWRARLLSLTVPVYVELTPDDART